jgi:AcrR family transcriptional regulator
MPQRMPRPGRRPLVPGCQYDGLIGKDGGVADSAAAPAGSPRQTPTRDRILDAGWEVFRDRGFDGTTVTEIEARAGLAAGSGGFYRHFASKEALLRAVVDREVARADAGRELPPFELTVDARSALIVEFRRRLSNLRRLHPLVVVLARENRHLGDAKERLRALLVDKGLNLRAEILRSWMDQGVIPSRDPHALATVVVSALTGYQNATVFFGEAPGGTDEASFAAVLADLVLGGSSEADRPL